MKLSKTKECILYLYDYYPTRFTDYHEGISEKIIELKRGSVGAVDYFCRVVKAALDEAFENNLSGLEEYTVCVMPSHQKGQYSYGLKMLANFLAETYGMEDCSDLIIRTETHDRNAGGGGRSLSGQLETLGINDEYEVTDRKILLLDDIMTSGNSIFAVKKLLEEKGAKRFYALVLGKTTYPVTEVDSIFDLPYDFSDSESDIIEEAPEKITDESVACSYNIYNLAKIDITEWDFEEIKQQLEKKLTVYKNTVYTVDDIKAAKNAKIELNQAKKIIETARKEYKRLCLEPYTVLEPSIIELTNMIEEQRINVDEFIKGCERDRIDKKEEAIRAYYNKISSPLGEYADVLYGRLRDPKWFNKGTSKAKYEESIRIAITESAEAIKIIRELNSPFYNTVIEKYLNTLSLQQAIAKHEELMMAVNKSELARDMTPTKGQGIHLTKDNMDANIRKVKIYADDIQFEKILKYMESIGAKYSVEE